MGRSVKATGQGVVRFVSRNTGRGFCLKDVLYVPELAYSLLSVSKASTVGAKVMFEGKKCKILADDGELIAEATKEWRTLLS